MSAAPVMTHPVTVPLLAPDVVGDPPADHHDVGNPTSYAQPVAGKPDNWRARSTGHWKAIGELYLEILTKLHRQRGVPPPSPSTTIVQMRADARRRARAMFGDDYATS